MLQIKNLSVTLEDKEILDNINLNFSKSTINIIMGPNGSGKSSLAYTLMGHPRYNINSGSIIINSPNSQEQINLIKLPVEQRARAGLFLASQYQQAIAGVKVLTFLKEAHRTLTGLDMSVKEFQDLLYHALSLVGLDNSFAHRNLYEGFSGGEKKRLEIAQLIILEPKIAILDEIDSGLDIDAIKIIAQAINYARQINPDLTIILITHYNRILKYLRPDHVYLLSAGKIINSGDSTLADKIEKWGYHGLQL